MAYADILLTEEFESNYLAVISPRRKVTSWTSAGGGIYTKAFTYGYVNAVEASGTALTAHTSSSLSAGQFYYDSSAQILYIRNTADANPSTLFMTAAYEIYVGTVDIQWNRIPTDASTDVVYFDRLILKAPNLKAASTDSLFGFMPTQTSQIELANNESSLTSHLYDASFNKGSIKLYHWVGDSLQVSAISQVMSGLMSDVSYSDDKVSINLFDRTDVLNQDFQMEVGNNNKRFFDTTTFPLLDPARVGKPIRAVYGMVDGFVPVGINYETVAPTTSNNRRYVVTGQLYVDAPTARLDSEIVSGAAHTLTRTYVVSTDGFNVGDAVSLTDSFAATVTEYPHITAVNRTAHYIDHTAIGTVRVGGVGTYCRRSVIGSVTVFQNGVRYAISTQYFTASTYGGQTYGFMFAAALEAAYGMPNTLSANDKVFCRIYGKESNVTLGGVAFGSTDAETGVLSQGVVILFDILKRAGISEDDMNLASFQALQLTNTDRICLAIPANAGDELPTFREVVASILQTLMLKLYFDEDSKWTISAVEPLGTTDQTLTDQEIFETSFDYSFSYGDVLSTVVVEYNFQESLDSALGLPGSGQSVVVENDTGKYLHKVTQTKRFKSLHMDSAEATVLAQRLSYALGERRGTARVKVGPKFTQSLLTEVATVTREKMPGFAYAAGTDQERDFSIIETNKDLNSVELVLDDQKGIEDNSGSW